MKPTELLLFGALCMAPGILIAWLAGFAMRLIAPRVGLIDKPGHRKVHHTPTPLGGGVAISLGVLLPCLGLVVLAQMPSARVAWLSGTLQSWLAIHRGGLLEKTPQLAVFLVLAITLLLLGLADDFWGLPWKLRIAVQAGASLAVLLGLQWRLTFFLDSPWITGPLTLLWIVWLVNAFNMLDNMDGLSGGIAMIASLFMAAVLLIHPEPRGSGPQLFVGGFLLLLSGSLLGFLYHNRTPAKLFMGDAGSYFIGFCLAVCTLLATFAGGDTPRHAIVAPLCILAIPMYDTLSVIYIRLRERRSPFVGDKSHFSHRLVDLGLSKAQAVNMIYLATVGCCLGSLLLPQVTPWGAIVVLAMVACFLCFIAIMESAARRRQR